MLKQGDKNLQVVRLQLQLRTLGYFKGWIDGLFSQSLKEAVIKFQTDTRLMIDGIAGNQTNSELTSRTKEDIFILFLHCAATPEGRNDSAEKVKQFHTMSVAKGGRGWDRCGYSDIIELNGRLVNMQDWNQDAFIKEWEQTWGVHGSTMLNRNARHLCYIGGMDREYKEVKDTRNFAQLNTMETYIKFTLLRYPNIVIAGHNQVQPKGCPSFDVPDYLREIGIAEKNIAKWGKLYK